MSGFMRAILRWLRGESADDVRAPQSLQVAANEPVDLAPVQSSLPELTTAIVGANPKEQLALLTLSGNLRDAMVTRYREQWAQSGSLIESGGKVAPSTILSVVGAAGGSVGLSTAMSG